MAELPTEYDNVNRRDRCGGRDNNGTDEKHNWDGDEWIEWRR